MSKLEELNGKVIKEIIGLEQYSDEVVIKTECGRSYMFLHHQDCCERVALEEFDNDINDHSGAVVTCAEEIESDKPVSEFNYDESETWTFYKIETNKGGLFMRWLGSSNGYYSESVDFEEVT